MKALFFAEGGPGVGLGHLRRCVALADGMTRLGWDCRFLAREASIGAWLTERGQTLAACPPPPAGRLPDADYVCDVFIVDSYAVSNDEITAKAKGKAGVVLAFDDRMDRHPAADVVLNSGVLAPERTWPGQVERLLGPKNHPLPSDFLPLPQRREISARIGRVLVTLGGAGKASLFERVVAAVRRALPDAKIDCVVGPFAEEPIGLKNDASVTLIRAPHSLKQLMRDCDLAVASSGQTLFELAATGTPAVAVALAGDPRDDQHGNLLGMERAGCVLAAGSITDADFERTLTARLSRAAAADVRRELSESGRILIDGQGAARVADALRVLVEKRRAAR